MGINVTCDRHRAVTSPVSSYLQVNPSLQQVGEVSVPEVVEANLRDTSLLDQVLERTTGEVHWVNVPSLAVGKEPPLLIPILHPFLLLVDTFDMVQENVDEHRADHHGPPASFALGRLDNHALTGVDKLTDNAQVAFFGVEVFSL